MKISQSEARRLRARVKQLEAERKALYFSWREDQLTEMRYLGQSSVSPTALERIRAAKYLNHPITVVIANSDVLEFYATKEVF